MNEATDLQALANKLISNATQDPVGMIIVLFSGISEPHVHRLSFGLSDDDYIYHSFFGWSYEQPIM